MAEAALKQPSIPAARSVEQPPLKLEEASPAPAEARAKPEAPSKESADAPPPAKSGRRTKVLLAAGAVALAAALYFGLNWWFVGRYLVSTDNAYVGADMTIVAPRVSGYVAAVPARANAHVKTGDPLVVLDDGDYRIAVEQADAKIATQNAAITRFDRQIVAAQAAVEQARAGLTAAEADQRRADADFQRTDQLTSNNFASKASFDAARATRDRAHAMTEQARASIAAAEANLEVLRAQKTEAERVRRELETALAKARRDLEATVIRAPFAGAVGNKAVEVGDYVGPGKRLLALVPAEGVYVEANFKETQLAGIHVGQKVKLILDADSKEPLEGVVESFAPASGALFSLLPPENATGNFTKVVQRLTVRIRVTAGHERLLLPGLSVIATVDTRTGQNSAEAAPKR